MSKPPAITECPCYHICSGLGSSLKTGGKASVPPDAVVAFVVGAFLSCIFWWLQHEARLPPEAVHGVFHQLTAPGVEAALGGQPAR